MYRLLFIFFLAISVSNIFGQYAIQGLVINKNTNTPLIGCSVYNVTKQRGTITNEDGEYKISADKGDIIQFSFIGMSIVEKYVIDSSDMDVELVYQVKQLKAVSVATEKLSRRSALANPDYEKYKKRQYVDPTPKTPEEMVKAAGPQLGGTGIQMSPISMLYYAFNKRERRRLTAVADIKKMDLSNQIYNLDFISNITKVNDQDELKDIKAYCYFPHDQVLSSTYYELGVMLKDCYVEYLDYRKTHPIVIPENIPVLDSTDFR